MIMTIGEDRVDVPDGQWHHVAANVGIDGTRIYLDGRLSA